MDMLCIDLLFAQPYRMFVVYCPPSASAELDTMINLVKCIENYGNRVGPTVITGDFNCPNIKSKK